ncbi:MAG: hypothetical protein AB8G99_18955 [Planctomycetaceae bacterium]
MQLDGASITIERRKITGCLDLAVVFVQQHFLPIARMTLSFAVPSCVISWLLMSQTELDIWSTIILFLVLSPIFGAALTIAAGRRVFGSDFNPRNAFTTLRTRFWTLLFYTVATRIVAAVFSCLVLPPLLVIVRYGFLAEILFLEGTPRKKVSSRLKNLMKNVYSDLVGRGLGAFLFYVVAVLGMYALVELGSSLLLGIPLVVGRLASFTGLEDELMILLLSDPRFATVLHALLWFIYPVVRLAWFFCYLDVRIQKEGWDVELDYRIEAQRLSGLA